MTTATIERKSTDSKFEVVRLVTPRKVAPMDLRTEPAYGKTIIDALDARVAATPRELALSIGISELVVRSVLEALTYVSSVDFDPVTGRYSTRFSIRV